MSIKIQINEVIDLLSSALENKDWSCVSESYFLLTGEEKDIENYENPLDQNTNELFSILMERIDRLEENKTNNRSKSKNSSADKKKPTKVNQDDEVNFSLDIPKKSRKVQSTRENKFEKMTDVLIEAEKENGFDKIKDNVKPSERNRKQYTPKNVQCTECNKSYEVHPLFAKDNYTCDKCISKRGR
jgi:hypothetical protein